MLMKAVEKQGWKAVPEPEALLASRAHGPRAYVPGAPDVPLEAVGLAGKER